MRPHQTWRHPTANLWLICLCLGFLFAASDAMAAPRKFEMALWGSSNRDYVDLAWFSGGDQPAGRSILQVSPYTDISSLNYDWSRIAAVVIDEPYWSVTDGTWWNPCYDPNDQRNAAFVGVANGLANVAAAVHAASNGVTRFWVNFSEPEVQWMSDPYCPMPFDLAYIDVISLDKYNVPFSQVKPYYDWFAANRPKNTQQLALVPGTFYIESPNYVDPYTQASYFQGYFDYANSMNNVGWDAPMVWLVAGWPGVGEDNLAPGDIGGGNIWRGIFTQGAWYMAYVWQLQFQNEHSDVFAGVVEYFDPDNGVISGWAVDRTKQTPPYVDFWIDGWNLYWGGTIANQSRPDVGYYYGINQAGYSIQLPVWFNDGGCHHMDAWAVATTPGDGVMKLSPFMSTDFCFGGYAPPPEPWNEPR